MANVLIVGCGGIGCELGVTLSEQGHKVYGLRRDVSEIPSGIEPIEADLSNSALPFPEQIDYVFYMASAGKHKDVAYYQAYVSGVKHTLKNLQDRNIKRIFFISSSSVFGQHEGERVTEESPTIGNNFSTKRLLEGEELIQNSGLPNTIVRFGGIYGPGRTHLIELVQQGKAHCMEDVYSNRIHSADCVGILAHLLTLNEQNPKQVDSLYIGVDDQPTLSCEVYEWLAEQLNVGHIEHLEPTENSRLMRSNKRLSNAKIRATGYEFKYPTYQDGYGELI